MHWAPVYSFCNPCQVGKAQPEGFNIFNIYITFIQKPDFLLLFQTYFQVNLNSILKFETLDEDTDNILKRIHASEKLTKVKKKNQTKGKKSSNFVFQYLKQLDKDIYKNLINIYRIDFHIFGYSIPHYESL